MEHLTWHSKTANPRGQSVDYSVLRLSSKIAVHSSFVFVFFLLFSLLRIFSPSTCSSLHAYLSAQDEVRHIPQRILIAASSVFP